MLKSMLVHKYSGKIFKDFFVFIFVLKFWFGDARIQDIRCQPCVEKLHCKSKFF